jgi:uncharacterized protein HemY
LAEIAGYENNKLVKDSLIKSFFEESTSKQYGDMYAKYNFFNAANELMQYNTALQIAEQEVKNRPTAESYNLLAWATYKMGNTAKAIDIITTKVENKTYEPEAMYTIGMIYAGAKKNKEAKQFLTLALQAAYELGPNAAMEITKTVKAL